MDVPPDDTSPAAETQAFQVWQGIKVNVRGLGQPLVEAHCPPDSELPWPSDGSSLVSKHGLQILVRLAMEHLKRHDLNPASGIAPQCKDHYSRPCRLLGAARVVLALGWAPDEIAAAEPARQLDTVARRAQSALRAFQEELESYMQSRAHLHATNPWGCMASHEVRCGIPAQIVQIAEGLQAALADLRAYGLEPQFPEFQRGTARLGLLKQAESDLFSNDWTLDEILTVLDDEKGGTLVLRKDRLRHRLGTVPGMQPPSE